MRITLPREEFLEAVGWTARILPAKPYSPILGGIHISAGAGLANFAAYDTEMSSEISLGIGENEPGVVLVSGRLLSAISKTLPKQDVTLFTEVGSTSAYLRCGKAEFSLPTMNAKEYPVLPILPEDTASIDADALAMAMAQTLPAVSQDQAQPQLCAVALEFTSPELLTLFATDKHRVAIRELGWSPKEPDPGKYNGQKLIIPSRAALELQRLGGEEFVYLGATGDAAGILGIHAGKHRTTTRLIDAPFPNCRSIMAKAHDGLAVVDSDDLVGALQRVILLDDDEFPRVHLKFAATLIELTGGRENVGGVSDELDATFYGLAQQLWVNPRYLADAVVACRSDKVVIGLQGHQKPITIVPYATDVEPPTQPFPPLQSEYIHLVMPTAGPPTNV